MEASPQLKPRGQTGGWEAKLVEGDLQCPICIQFFFEPLKLTCGHAFCRLCLLKATKLAPDGRRCPTCRAAIELKDPLTAPTDVELERRVEKAVPPEELEARNEADAEELENLLRSERQKIPVFYMRGVESQPGKPVVLHFFEPRYRVLIRRAWEGDRRFLCAQRAPREGDEVLVVEVHRAVFLPDGRANIQGMGVQRATVMRSWVEDGTEGLHYAEVDTPMKRIVSDRLEAQACQVLRAAIRSGAPEYNRGRIDVCLELYFDAALNVVHMIGEEGPVAERLRAGMVEARQLRAERNSDAAAWALRRSFDDVLALRSAVTARQSRDRSELVQSSPGCCSVQ